VTFDALPSSKANVSGPPKMFMKPLPKPVTRLMHCGTAITLRAVAPSDAPGLDALMRRMSAAARRNRFHMATNMLCAQQLHRMSCVDQQTQVAFVMTTAGEGCDDIVADARYAMNSFDTALDGTRGAELGVVVDERWQRKGLGGHAIAALTAAARSAGLGWLYANVLTHNEAMLALLRRSQFCCNTDPDDETIVRAELSLAVGLCSPMSLWSRFWTDPMRQRWSGFKKAGGQRHASAD
jgi:acetyltransferase